MMCPVREPESPPPAVVLFIGTLHSAWLFCCRAFWRIPLNFLLFLEVEPQLLSAGCSVRKSKVKCISSSRGRAKDSSRFACGVQLSLLNGDLKSMIIKWKEAEFADFWDSGEGRGKLGFLSTFFPLDKGKPLRLQVYCVIGITEMWCIFSGWETPAPNLWQQRAVGSQSREEASFSVKQQLPSLLPVGLFISLLFGENTAFSWEVPELQEVKG